MIIKEPAKILSQTCLAEDIYSVWLKTSIAKEASPGQFVSLFTKDRSKLLPRPISICEMCTEENALRLVYRVTGADTGTKQFSFIDAGDQIGIMGPLGNGFVLEKGAQRKVLLVGGGIGIPPMLALAKELAGNATVEMIMGYRSELFLTSELEQYGTLHLTTDDGSAGIKGHVLQGIEELNLLPEVIYACGPTPMLRGIKKFAVEKNIPCYVSMEEKMACGIGACLACVCRSVELDEYSQGYTKRICKDGPVFLATEVEV